MSIDASALAALDVKLPLQVDPTDSATVVDADGRDVLVIDVNGMRPDIKVAEIAEFVALACNTFAAAAPIGWRIVNGDRHTVMWDYDRDRLTWLRDASYPELAIEAMWSHAPEVANG